MNKNNYDFLNEENKNLLSNSKIDINLLKKFNFCLYFKKIDLEIIILFFYLINKYIIIIKEIIG